MKTDELIGMLATNIGAESGYARAGASQRFLLALGWGAFGSTLLMAVLLGVREDLRDAALLPMFWVKLAFPLSLAIAALFASERMGRPGMLLGRVRVALFVPVAIIWVLAAVSLAGASGAEREGLVYGQSWKECQQSIALLSLPMLVASFWAMRGLAPTRTRLAGGMAGLLAGAVGAAAYALHCPELAAPFLGAWYLIGMLIPALAGALVAPLLLRW